MPVLVSNKELIGHLAMWAIRQHPYHRPEGLFDLAEVLNNATLAWDCSTGNLNMKYFDSHLEVESFIRNALKDHPVLEHWNTSQKDSGALFVSCSRYDSPKPEYDFIDIDALLCNVAHGVWHEAKEQYDETAVATEEKQQHPVSTAICVNEDPVVIGQV